MAGLMTRDGFVAAATATLLSDARLGIARLVLVEGLALDEVALMHAQSVAQVTEIVESVRRSGERVGVFARFWSDLVVLDPRSTVCRVKWLRQAAWPRFATAGVNCTPWQFGRLIALKLGRPALYAPRGPYHVGIRLRFNRAVDL
jgi:hypothetical protein